MEQEAESCLRCKLFLQAELQAARCQAAASASVSCDSVQERSRCAARATSSFGTCGGTRGWQTALRRRRRGLATGRVCLSRVSGVMSRRCAASVVCGETTLAHAGSAGRAALRLSVAVAFGLGMCMTPERVCRLRGLRARRVGRRRVCVARCGMGVCGVGVRRRCRGAGRVSLRGAPRLNDAELERVLEDVESARRGQGGVAVRGEIWLGLSLCREARASVVIGASGVQP